MQGDGMGWQATAVKSCITPIFTKDPTVLGCPIRLRPSLAQMLHRLPLTGTLSRDTRFMREDICACACAVSRRAARDCITHGVRSGRHRRDVRASGFQAHRKHRGLVHAPGGSDCPRVEGLR